MTGRGVFAGAMIPTHETASKLFSPCSMKVGTSGSELIRFVVDTTGRAEMSSFKVLKSSHDLFTNSVKNALAQMRFYPAEIGGRKVKQLVQQPFNFTLTK